ncbi:ATP-dependent zinc metalloprotease FtsH [Gillisia sp. M10.2A]|uniref:ATP-dependent zinc metalloprotease FtsH n=1 Tax=Gillisia lutea TaxID=2909668 RepID=A0ABS9EEU0_9FLAO|nr:ATP-dependent zinc metalloprotease FtsH [Gillisia lutea]MCF4101391.1 ATP-dependent zinc metalloprotease FtsH [Gillisia lutea]
MESQQPNKIHKQPEKKPPKSPLNGSGSLWIYLIISVTFIALYLFISPEFTTKEISWKEFENTILPTEKIEQIIIVNKEIAEIYVKAKLTDSTKYDQITDNSFNLSQTTPAYTIQIGSVDSFENKLEKAQQELPTADRITVTYTSRSSFLDIFSWLIPLGILIFFWIFILKRMSTGSGSNPLFNFGKTTARISETDKKSSVSFNDIAGLKEAKVEVMEVVDFLKNPETYTKLGAKIPKGVMLVGPPGTGKTLMARAVAGEAQVPFFSLSGSEFVEMFVGVGASRVRDLFKRAKEKAPSIIFIDEIDAVGRSRGKVNAFQTNDERESTLNQLLTELDGFGPNTGVIVLAATNRPDILDKALLRPGRFDRHIYLELPNKHEREEIFKVHMRNLVLGEDVAIDILATLSPGFSGADIANICNEAALIAARKKTEAIMQEDFLEARDRVVGGLERKSKIISPKEKKIIAFHEAGHAVASWYLEHVDSLVKVSIIPRGKSLGSAWYLPEERQIVTKSQFMDQICASLGGRAAEEIIFNEISSGAIDDLEKITKQAYAMVAYYGLDESIGPLSFFDSSEQSRTLFGKPYSEHMAKLIDEEVQQLISKSYQRTKEILTTHKAKLIQLAELLLKKETVEKEDLIELLGARDRKFLETDDHTNQSLSQFNKT